MPDRLHPDTAAVHAGERRPGVEGAVVLPIFQTAQYEFGTPGASKELKYIRYNNTPNHDALAGKLAALEGTEAALATGSGMAAISAALLAFLGSGDHLLAINSLYGGTLDFVSNALPSLGITHTLVDMHRPEAWRAALTPRTKVLYVESITNPTVQVPDLKAAVAFAREHGLVTLIDNTFTSPINFKPAEIGFDVTLESATKYLNGHSDIVAGVVAGSDELVHRVGKRLKLLGGTLDPHACFLLHRGIKTVHLRVERQNRNALAVASHLSRHARVARVNYPGLETHPAHARARSLFRGFGGMLSFELKDGAGGARRLIEGVRMIIPAGSLGSVESLITIPAETSHAALTPEQRRAIGVGDGLVRLSVGVESPDDIIADLERALA